MAPVGFTEPATGLRKTYAKGTGFYKESDVYSFEARGAINDKFISSIPTWP